MVLNLISTYLSSTTQNIKNNIYYQEYTVYHKWIAQAKFINRTIKKYHTVGTTTQSNVQVLKRGEIDTPCTQIHYCGFSLLSTGTSIKSCGVEMALWTDTSPLSEVMRSCMCCPNGSKISTLTYTEYFNSFWLCDLESL